MTNNEKKLKKLEEQLVGVADTLVLFEQKKNGLLKDITAVKAAIAAEAKNSFEKNWTPIKANFIKLFQLNHPTCGGVLSGWAHKGFFGNWAFETVDEVEVDDFNSYFILACKNKTTGSTTHWKVSGKYKEWGGDFIVNWDSAKKVTAKKKTITEWS